MPNAPHHATGSPSGLVSAVRKDAPIQSTINCCSCLGTASCYCRGMAIISWRAWASGVAVWVWQFLWLDKRNSGHLPVCSRALGGWPDGHASEEYQTQSYFCLSSRSAPDGSQGLPESPAVLPAHLNTTTHTETTQSWVYVIEPKVSPSVLQLDQVLLLGFLPLK